MKIKLDENLPRGLVEILHDLGHNAETIHREGLAGSDDLIVWEAVKRERRFLITQDLDFSDARKFFPGTHAGILLIRLHRPSRANLIDRVRDVFQNEVVDQWAECFVIATERKVRILRP